MSETKPKPKTGNRGYHNRQSARETMGDSWSQEAEELLREANAELGSFTHKHLDNTRSLHLRKAARLLTKCADTMDYVKELKGESLMPHLKKEAKA